jgi:ArsR family metal-binding transcriptional regulator
LSSPLSAFDIAAVTGDDMLIEDNELDITCSQWHPGDEEWVAKAKIGADLTAVMPYVNALVKMPEYVPDVPVIIWKDGEHQVAVRPHEIAINHLPDSAAAEERVRAVVAWINDIWEKRGDITPSHEPKSSPPLMSVLKLLPRNNCRDCGLPTCTAFAVQLRDGDRHIEDCPALLGDENRESADKLRQMGLS